MATIKKIKIKSATGSDIIRDIAVDAVNVSGKVASATSADSATTATKATSDESGNNIKSTYGSTLSIDTTTRKIELKNKNGTSISSITLPTDKDTTYTKFSTTAMGLVPVGENSTTKFLRSDGNWAEVSTPDFTYTAAPNSQITVDNRQIATKPATASTISGYTKATTSELVYGNDVRLVGKEGHTFTLSDINSTTNSKNYGVATTTAYGHVKLRSATNMLTTTSSYDSGDAVEAASLKTLLQDNVNKANAKMVKYLVDLFYPIGSIYINKSKDKTISLQNPNERFPGTTWKRIEKRMLWAEGIDEGDNIGYDNIIDGNISYDSSRYITIKQKNLPTTAINARILGGNDGNTPLESTKGTYSNTLGGQKWGPWFGSGYEATDNVKIKLNTTSSQEKIDKLPPFIAVAMWERTA